MATATGVTCTKIWEDWNALPNRCSWTNKQTNTVTTILRYPTVGQSKN